MTNEAAERLRALILNLYRGYGENAERPGVNGDRVAMLNTVDQALAAERRATVEGLIPDRWLTPDQDPSREPINIHPEAKKALRHFLHSDGMEGVGYSEFIYRAVAMWRAILDAEAER